MAKKPTLDYERLTAPPAAGQGWRRAIAQTGWLAIALAGAAALLALGGPDMKVARAAAHAATVSATLTAMLGLMLCARRWAAPSPFGWLCLHLILAAAGAGGLLFLLNR